MTEEAPPRVTLVQDPRDLSTLIADFAARQVI